MDIYQIDKSREFGCEYIVVVDGLDGEEVYRAKDKRDASLFIAQVKATTAQHRRDTRRGGVTRVRNDVWPTNCRG